MAGQVSAAVIMRRGAASMRLEQLDRLLANKEQADRLLADIEAARDAALATEARANDRVKAALDAEEVLTADRAALERDQAAHAERVRTDTADLEAKRQVLILERQQHDDAVASFEREKAAWAETLAAQSDALAARASELANEKIKIEGWAYEARGLAAVLADQEVELAADREAFETERARQREAVEAARQALGMSDAPQGPVPDQPSLGEPGDVAHGSTT